MEPSLKVLLFAVIYVFVCMGICLMFRVGCYEENDEDTELLVNLHHQALKDEEEDNFHTEGSTYL